MHRGAPSPYQESGAPLENVMDAIASVIQARATGCARHCFPGRDVEVAVRVDRTAHSASYHVEIFTPDLEWSEIESAHKCIKACLDRQNLPGTAIDVWVIPASELDPVFLP